MADKQTLVDADLRAFSGSEQFYRHPINRSLLYTDGVRFVAETGGAYWLIDEIALGQTRRAIAEQGFQTWILTREKTGTGATLACEDGNGGRVWCKRIPFTDFPLPEIRFFLCDNGHGRTLMLPGEYEMDPQANLSEQASIAAELTLIQDAAADDGSLTHDQLARVEHLAFRLAELVVALIQWQAGGGHWPNVHLANDVLRHRGIR